jgi:chloramphenicol 3-O-phosphotransferase
MKIRAITGFIDPGWPIDTDFIAKTTHCLKDCRRRLQRCQPRLHLPIDQTWLAGLKLKYSFRASIMRR